MYTKEMMGAAVAAVASMLLIVGQASADTKVVKAGMTTPAVSPISGPVDGAAVLNFGSITFSCTGGGFSANLGANPDSPVSFSMTALNFGPPCTDNLGGGFDVSHLDLVSGGSGTITENVSLSSSGGDLNIPSITVRMHWTFYGIPVTTCDYVPTYGADGSADNADHSITFSDVPIAEVTTNAVCPDAGDASVRFAEIADNDGDMVEVVD